MRWKPLLNVGRLQRNFLHYWMIVCFAKLLTSFDKRQIIRACPGSDVDCVYTPGLDRFLQDLVPKYTVDDKVFRKMQVLLLDVTVPISMSYEMVLHAKENST